MANEESLDAFDPFSICFTKLKLKYVDLSYSLSTMKFCNNVNDRVNVFINMESIYKHFSMIQELERKILLQRDFDQLVEANFLNIIGHYKRYFAANGINDVKVYIYQTAFDSENFSQNKYNTDFRSYYYNKYNENPKFVMFTDRLKDTILPHVKEYCNFIPNTYCIISENIEGSLIPYIIANNDPTRKNIIAGMEFYETQYNYIPNFLSYFIQRMPTKSLIIANPAGGISYLSQKTDKSELQPYLDIFNTYEMYCSLLATCGDKPRSIEKLSGYRAATLLKSIKEGIDTDVISPETTNPSTISEVFKDDNTREAFVNNFNCTSIKKMYEEMTDAEKLSIMNQLIDRCDKHSLELLNNTRFNNHRVILDYLI